nr:unnamed protein product [Callosobruchus analis]
MPLEDNKKIPIPNIITEIEYAIKELPTDNKNEIRANCCNILTNHKKKQDETTYKETKIDPTNKFQKTNNELIKKWKDNNYISPEVAKI